VGSHEGGGNNAPALPGGIVKTLAELASDVYDSVTYKERRLIEYQDGLPVIDPAGEEDPIFHEIARHRAAITHYDRCLTVEQEAEGNVSDNEYSYLQHNTKNHSIT